LEFTPRLGYSFSANGIQEPTHAVNLGFLDQYWKNRIKLDVSFNLSQYPRNSQENDLSLGETISIAWHIRDSQVLRLRERYSRYGDRESIVAGGYYELYF
jgi:hypothetical protein